jgi:hypothetical protein
LQHLEGQVEAEDGVPEGITGWRRAAMLAGDTLMAEDCENASRERRYNGEEDDQVDQKSYI